MSEPKPATDQEIADKRSWFEESDHDHDATNAQYCNDVFGQRLIARIQSDAAKLRELDEQIAELVSALSGLVKINEKWNAMVERTIGRPPNWTDGYLDMARAVLARRKEAV